MLLLQFCKKSVLDLQKSAQLFDTGYITILCIVGSMYRAPCYQYYEIL